MSLTEQFQEIILDNYTIQECYDLGVLARELETIITIGGILDHRQDYSKGIDMHPYPKRQADDPFWNIGGS